MHTLVLVGELDRTSTAMLEAALEGLCEREVAQIALDLRQLTRIDAIGVAVIAFRCGWCERHGVALTLIAGPPHVQRAFAHARMLERLPFVAPARAPHVVEQQLVVVDA
jgi:anti-anti-sigma factor